MHWVSFQIKKLRKYYPSWKSTLNVITQHVKWIKVIKIKKNKKLFYVFVFDNWSFYYGIEFTHKKNCSYFRHIATCDKQHLTANPFCKQQQQYTLNAFIPLLLNDTLTHA